MAASHEAVGMSVRRNQSERIGACCSQKRKEQAIDTKPTSFLCEPKNAKEYQGSPDD